MSKNMSPVREKAAEQAADVRITNFCEVALGYNAEQVISEAQRCLNCKNAPCVSGCPVNVQIPDFIARLAENDPAGAYDVISKNNALPAICGRVCPQENQCEKHCVRGKKGEAVSIGRLERYAADCHLAAMADAPKAKAQPTGKRVAVIGAGPAGLTCAGALARKGYRVTVFEAFHKAGGVLVYGIPEFRLPKAIVQKEVDALIDLGVEIELNAVVGRAISVDELFEDGYEAIFLGTGAGLPMFMGIEGENLNGVFSANEYLTRINLMRAYDPDYDTPIIHAKRVFVVGGGNVAMDAARCARRLGAEVTIMYRRSMEELPARAEEVHHAKEEGITFECLTSPLSITGDENGWVKSIHCQRMTLGEPDASGRRSPVPVEGDVFEEEADAVIMAIGTSPNPIIRSTTQGLEANRKGCIVADEGGATSREGVFAGGDAVTGAATVILAMGAGKRAAESIDEYLKAKG